MFQNLEDPKAPNIWMIEPQFRVNQAYEVGGSQVIGWEVTSGEGSASLYGGGKRIKWSVCEDIKIKFLILPQIKKASPPAGIITKDYDPVEIAYPYSKNKAK